MIIKKTKTWQVSPQKDDPLSKTPVKSSDLDWLNTHQQYKGPRQHTHLAAELNQGTGSSCYTRGSQGLMLMMLAFPRHGNSCAHTPS